MDIPEDLKSRLLSELDFVIRKVDEEEDAVRKLYFLSAAHGAVERTMRFCANDELLIVHAVLNLCYSTLLDRFNRMKGGDTAVQLPEKWTEQVLQNLRELREKIARNETTYPVLEKIIRLSYSVTGPGYYTFAYLQSQGN